VGKTVRRSGCEVGAADGGASRRIGQLGFRSDAVERRRQGAPSRSGRRPRQGGAEARTQVGTPNWPAGVGCLEKDNLKLKVIGPKWQSCPTFDSSFGYKEGDTYRSVKSVIYEMVEVISRNGNFLINIGPKADGTIPEPQLERLQAMGGLVADQWRRHLRFTPPTELGESKDAWTFEIVTDRQQHVPSAMQSDAMVNPLTSGSTAAMKGSKSGRFSASPTVVRSRFLKRHWQKSRNEWGGDVTPKRLVGKVFQVVVLASAD